MRPSIPYLVEGEVYAVQEHVETPRKPIRYICKVDLGDGTISLLPNCIQSSMFGGIDDYLQFRSRSSKDSGENTETSRNSEKNNAQIGDRVYIAFVGGNIQKPVIIGYAQHPNQNYEFESKDPIELKPNLVFKYLGIKATVDEKGQFKFIHRGAPKIKYSPKIGGFAGAALDAASSLLGSGQDKANPSVEPQDPENTTLAEFLDKGVFRIRDAEGQIIEIDRTKKRIYISNNDLKSTQNPDDAGVLGNQFATNSTPAEYVMLDKDKELVLVNARGIIQLYSFDRRKDVTEGNYSSKVYGDNQWTVGGDEKHNITGAWEVVSAGDAVINGSGGILKLSKGQVGLGNSTVELVDTVVKLMEKVIEISKNVVDASLQPLGNLGFSTTPSPAAIAAYGKLQAELEILKTQLDTIKGGV